MSRLVTALEPVPPTPRRSDDHPFIYEPEFLENSESTTLLQTLLRQAPWQSHFIAFGRQVKLPRQQVWYADAHVDSRYGARNLLRRMDFTPDLLDLRRRVELACGRSFNAVLATLYLDGNDYVDFHADDDPELGKEPLIASVSLGSTRRFCLRPKRKQGLEVVRAYPLNHGDLLILLPLMQHQWEHAVLAEPECSEPRINLTFRAVS